MWWADGRESGGMGDMNVPDIVWKVGGGGGRVGGIGFAVGV